MDTPETVSLEILEAALEAAGLLRPLTVSEWYGYSYPSSDARIAHFGPYTFITDKNGSYLEVADESDTNGMRVVAATAA